MGIVIKIWVMIEKGNDNVIFVYIYNESCYNKINMYWNNN